MASQLTSTRKSQTASERKKSKRMKGVINSGHIDLAWLIILH